MIAMQLHASNDDSVERTVRLWPSQRLGQHLGRQLAGEGYRQRRLEFAQPAIEARHPGSAEGIGIAAGLASSTWAEPGATLLGRCHTPSGASGSNTDPSGTISRNVPCASPAQTSQA